MKKQYVIIGLIVVLVTIVIIVVIPKRNTINVGVIGNFSQGETSYAQLGYDGILLAANEINEIQNTDRYRLHQIDISVYDTDAKLEDEIDRVDADILFGPFLSSSLTSVGDFIKSLDIPVFVVSATHDIGSGIDDNVFRIMNSTSIQAHQTAEMLASLDYQNVKLIYDTNNQMYTKEIMDYIMDDPAFDDVTTSLHELGETDIDFSTVITPSNEAIFLCANDAKTVEAVNAIREADIVIPIYLCSWSDSGLLLEGVNYDSLDVFMYTNRNIQHDESYDLFVSKFSNEFEVSPVIASMYGYELMYMVYFTYANSEGINDAFFTTLESYDPYRGVFFNYHNNQNGDYYTLMGLYEIKNHKFVKLNIIGN